MKRLSRILKIIQVFARYRLDTIFLGLSLPWYVRILFWLLPWRLFIPASKPEAVRIRLALEALGPVFVKFGQMLSTRRDLLTDELSEELKNYRTVYHHFPAPKRRP